MNDQSICNLQIIGVPHDLSEDQWTRLRQFEEDTMATHFAQMLTIDPEAYPLLDKVHSQLIPFQELLDRLNPTVKKGILIQTLFGHGERGAVSSSAGFQRMIGLDGALCQQSFCPLDTGFQQHIAEACQLIAKAQPAFILFDDDIRFLWHAPANRTCFCDAHVAKFSAEVGEHYQTREELASLLRSVTPDGLRLRKAWLSMQEAELVDLFTTLSSIIFSVSEDIQLGFCYTRDNRYFVNKIAKVLGQHRPPIMRTHGAIYANVTLKNYPLILDDIIRQKKELPSTAQVICEADTYPHSLFHTPVRFLDTHVSNSLLHGFDGWKAWLIDIANFHPEERGEFTRLFQRRQEYWHALRQIGRDVRWQGATIATHQGRDELASPSWGEHPPDGLAHFSWLPALGRLGIPIRMGESEGGIHFHTQDTIEKLSSGDMTRLLRGSLFLDGEAAALLAARGYSEHLGVSVQDDPDFRCSAEWVCPDEDLNGQAGDRFTPTIREMPNPLKHLTPLSDATRTAAWYVSTSHFGSRKMTPLRPSVTAYRNTLGGRIVIFAAPITYAPAFIHAERKWQIESLMRWCDFPALPITLANPQDILFQQGVLPTGDDLLFLTNLSSDDWDPLNIQYGPSAPDDVQILQENGTWTTVSFTYEVAKLSINAPLLANSVAAIIIKPPRA